MPASTDVRLPLGQTPNFPSTCVICGANHPDSAIVLKDRASGLLSAFFLPLLFFWLKEKVEVKAPACRTCVTSYRWMKMKFALFSFLLLALGIAAGLWLLPTGLNRLVKKLAMLGIVFVALLPYMIWAITNPLPFHIFADEEGVDYQFRDAAYAQGFAQLNNATISDL